MAIAAELQKLDELRQRGALTDDEYAQAKARVLHEQPSPGTGDQNVPSAAPYSAGPTQPDVYLDQQTRQWAMLLHISLLAGLAVPVAGLVVPILIWQLKKDELPGIDVHGKIVVNWIISFLIYVIGAALLMIVLIGLPLLLALMVLHIVFPIIGAIKANEGEAWRYPLSITFLS